MRAGHDPDTIQVLIYLLFSRQRILIIYYFFIICFHIFVIYFIFYFFFICFHIFVIYLIFFFFFNGQKKKKGG